MLSRYEVLVVSLASFKSLLAISFVLPDFLLTVLLAFCDALLCFLPVFYNLTFSLLFKLLAVTNSLFAVFQRSGVQLQGSLVVFLCKLSSLFV